MKPSYFPVTVIDDFFTNPLEIREFALSQEFTKDGRNYPGTRTRRLHEINEPLFNLLCGKVLSTWFDIFSKSYGWQVITCFQKISPNKERPILNEPWIHQDSMSILGGLIYFNQEESEEGGTTTYTLPDSKVAQKRIDQKEGNEVRFNVFDNPDKVSDEQIKMALQKNNEGFQPSVKISSKFNRLVCFDCETWHAQTSYGNWTEDRLTLPFFITKFEGDCSPLERVQEIQLQCGRLIRWTVNRA
jgi:hypothetical protein